MILSSIVFFPILCAVILALWPVQKTIKYLALGLATIEFILSLFLLAQFDASSAQLQFV